MAGRSRTRGEPPLLVPLPEGIPAFVGRLGYYESQPGRLPVTVLNNDWDIFWVRRGVAIWTLQTGERIEALPGDLAILPPFTPAVVTERDPPVAFWHCHFDFRALLGQMRDLERADALGPGRRALAPLSFPGRAAPGVERAYRALSRLYDRRLARPWLMQRALLDLIAELALFAEARTRRHAPGRLFAPAGQRDERIARVQALVRDQPTRAWRVTELADAVGLSAGHLHALCRQFMGRSLKRHLVEMRLQHALRLLKERPAGHLPSVKEVAAACGFSTQHFFSRQFRRYYGISPQQYRDKEALA